MKRVCSVSLGSSRRDHTAVVDFAGTPVELCRTGTDGDFDRALATLADLDGHVDAIGLGGIDLYLRVGDRRYTIRDGERLARAASRTPVVDGSGFKAVLEPDAVATLARRGLVTPASRVLMVSALDRWGMAQAFAELCGQTVFGDLIFNGGIPYPITTLAELEEIGHKVVPGMVKLPFHMLYPTGGRQDEAPDSRFADYYLGADIIAGDWHLIHRYLPERLDGRGVVTNTTTAADVADLAARGVTFVATTTPVYQGRSFGTNVLEAALVAVAGRPPADLGAEDYRAWAARLGLGPTVRYLDRGDEGGERSAGPELP